MKLQEIIEKLEERYPPGCAEEWDNPGLIVGRRQAEIRKVLVALDATDDVIDQAVAAGADLILTHHPLIFSPIRKLDEDDFIGRRVLHLAEKGIACYAMHTNFDIRKMADLNAAQLCLTDTRVLDVTGFDAYDLEEGIGKVGTLKKPMKLSEFALFVKKQLKLDVLRCYGPEDGDPEICTVAICGGAGRSTVPCAIMHGAQVLVTGDVDYHSAIDARMQGLYIVDAGHYGTESCFIPQMVKELSELFPELATEGAAIRQPFQTI